MLREKAQRPDTPQNMRSNAVFNEFLTSKIPLLTTCPSGSVRGWVRKQSEFRGKFMSDLIYVGVVVLFFAVSGLYVRLCEKM